MFTGNDEIFTKIFTGIFKHIQEMADYFLESFPWMINITYPYFKMQDNTCHIGAFDRTGMTLEVYHQELVIIPFC